MPVDHRSLLTRRSACRPSKRQAGTPRDGGPGAGQAARPVGAGSKATTSAAPETRRAGRQEGDSALDEKGTLLLIIRTDYRFSSPVQSHPLGL